MPFSIFYDLHIENQRMNFDPEYIKQLVLDEIAGTINDKEKDYLHNTILENPEAYDLYASLHNRYTSGRLEQIRAALPQNLDAGKTLQAAKRKNRLRLVRSATGIAATLALLAGVYFIFSNKAPEQSLAASSVKDHIALQLTGEKTIDLSSQQGNVQTDNIRLNNTNKTLTFSLNNTPATNSWATLTVPAGKDYTIRLPDSTEIQLNAATSLKFPLKFSGNTREVIINGEAYLKIARNENLPFIVHLPGTTVQVLGTEFNVNTYDSTQVKVALVNGSVKVKTGKENVLLKPGRLLTCKPGTTTATEDFNARETLSWRKGIYLFHNATFEEVSRVLPRWFGIEIVIDNPAIAQRRFTGIINRNQPVTASLDILKATNGIDYDMKDGVIHIK